MEDSPSKYLRLRPDSFRSGAASKGSSQYVAQIKKYGWSFLRSCGQRERRIEGHRVVFPHFRMGVQTSARLSIYCTVVRVYPRHFHYLQSAHNNNGKK